MNRLLSSLFVAALVVAPVAAQVPVASSGQPASVGFAGNIKITFTDGRVQTAFLVRRSKDTLLATIALAAGVKGEVGYPIAKIEKVEFPAPPQLATARKLLAAGNPSDALAQVDPVVAVQSGLRAVPGNRWAEAALVKVDALLALKRDGEAESLVNQLAADVKDPEQLESARIALAFVRVRNGKSDEAVAAFDEAIAGSKNPALLARAWQGKGEALLLKEDYDGALLAYLRGSIFYSNETLLLPASLLGSVRAYVGLGDFESAKAALDELNRSFPASPEAAAAKPDAERIQRKLNSTAATHAAP